MSEPTDSTARQFAAFAGVVRDEHPLYARLSDGIVGDSQLLDLAGLSMPGQPPPNMLFAAVQYLLLGGTHHELANWYPEISGLGPPGMHGRPVSDVSGVLPHAPPFDRTAGSQPAHPNERGRPLSRPPPGNRGGGRAST